MDENSGTVLSQVANKKPSSFARILERAIEVIDESGEAGIRTNTIAAECGVSPPILYRAFDSREGLIIAAQTERYRRSMDRMTTRLIDSIERSNSRDELQSAIAESLDAMFGPDRIPMRQLRAQVLGSAVSRPKLQDEIARINQDFSEQIVNGYKRATELQWINPLAPLDHLALWAIGMVNARILIEQGTQIDSDLGASWNSLTKTLILTALFGSTH